ncbi:MAG: hypothetical protein ACOC9S_01125 [Planctomycetota bacterium]
MQSTCVSLTCMVFQFAVGIQTERGETTAFLWLPPEAELVRGVVLAGSTLMERHFVRDPHIRDACADEQLAIAFLTDGLGAVDPQDVLDKLADASGYRELSAAPLLFVGHSAGGPPAKAHARRMASRCFGLIQYRGGGPGGGDPLPPGIPALMMIGQFDEFAGTMRDEDGRESWQRNVEHMADYRDADEGNLATILVEPGAGHFAWSERNAEYVAMWIRQAARAKIPRSGSVDADQAVRLRDIDPRNGWLTDLDLPTTGEHEPAPYDEYQLDKAETNWNFDREMAEATIDYHNGQMDKKDQFVKWQDLHWVDAGARFFFTRIEWIDDGQTFRVHPVYADEYPSRYNGRGPRWAQAGEPVGNSGVPIEVKVVGGPLVATGPDTFRMRYDAISPAGGRDRATFMAYSAGDDEYRYTEQVGMLPRGFRGLDRGSEQTITFPEVPDMTPDCGPVELGATSDSGLEVEYYVAYGPAVVRDGKLEIAELPARAELPIEVRVVAYQFGSGVEPQVRTAEPVAKTLRIVPPQ